MRTQYRGLRWSLLLLVIVGFWLAPPLLPNLRDLAQTLYGWANQIYASLGEPLNNLRLELGIPIVGAFLLGVLAATAPCQLSTNAAAVAYLSQDALRGRPWPRALAFLGGKTLVYLGLAGLTVWLFGGAFSAPGPLFAGVRRVLGPLMILLGLVTLGWLRLRLPLPAGSATLKTWSEARGGILGAFGLGLAFGLAFCPTLFWLFFGLMLPSAVASGTGVLFPALFSLGAALPLLLMLAFIESLGRKRAVIGGMRWLHRGLAIASGIVLLLAGLYDTLVYWFI